MEPTIYKPSIYKGAGIYKNGESGSGGGGGVVPEEYFELEYLEISRNVGPANFIISLNDFGNKDKIISCIFEIDGNFENLQRSIFYAGRNNNASPGILVNYNWRSASEKILYIRNSINSYYTPQTIFNNNSNKLKLLIQNNVVNIEFGDGSKIGSYAEYSESNGFNKLFIFTDRTNPGEWYQFYGKFFELEIQDIIKIVPAKRKLDGVIGLFDLISQTFITPNYGASNIVAGPVKM